MWNRNPPSTRKRSTPLWIRCKYLVQDAANQLIDPRARQLAEAVQWWELPGFPERWPIVVIGEGPPVLVIGGFDGSFLDATPLAVLLAAHHRLLIPDLYGFGFCPRPLDGEYSSEGILRHLDAVLSCATSMKGDDRHQDFKPPERVAVIGASMGTRVALEMARRRPDCIDRLLLLGPVGLSEPPVKQPGPQILVDISLYFLSLPWIRRCLRRYMHSNAAATCSKGELEICSLHLQAPGWKYSLLHFDRSGGFGKSYHGLPQIPILAILGTDDRLVRGRQRKSIVELLEGKLIELSSCGHLPQWEHPQEVAQVWAEWLTRTSR